MSAHCESDFVLRSEKLRTRLIKRSTNAENSLKTAPKGPVKNGAQTVLNGGISVNFGWNCALYG
jgi:hypothetical protein